ncbi:MAG: 5-formyltetrahydrofolate cyclo-ligase [Candidatus Omnitrophica bacterium]|nr:5-formyltetrahydrofolate cyclo-ligase [Candidatus Omnitrophota bacterium]
MRITVKNRVFKVNTKQARLRCKQFVYNMMNTVYNNKVNIRKEILNRLTKQDRDERKRKSGMIRDKLFSLPCFAEAHVVMFYVSREEEVDTHRMIKEALRIGKDVVVPYSVIETQEIIPSRLENEGDLEKGPYGIEQPRREALRPVPLEEIDVVIVPGVAFDEKNNRLGRGKGYYDRFLKRLQPRTITLGLGFDFQHVKNLPRDSHDLPVKKVITD